MLRLLCFKLRRTNMAEMYRADQVGSFLRPAELLDARQQFTEGRISREELTAAEDAAILRVLDMQRRAGINVVSDGEYRRTGWSSDFADAVDGYVEGRPAVAVQFKGGATPASTAPRSSAGTARGIIGARLQQRRRLTQHEASFLRQHASGPFKVTMPAPSYIVARGFTPGITDKVYAGRKELLADVAAIINAEVRALVAEGVPYIQLDNPHYPDYIDASRQGEWQALGIDPQVALQDDIEADNAAISGVDRTNVTFGMHFCRGNGVGGAWHTEGGYDPIAEMVFQGLNFDRLLLEYDSDRAGSFEPLRYVSANKTVVLGLITTKASALETQDDLVRRIEEAAAYIPLERLTLSPQCGFASTLQGNPLTWEEQQRKLELVVSTAQRVWGS